MTGVDMLRDAIDSIWGDNYFNNWFTGNESKYNSGTETFFQEGNQLENDPKGTGGLDTEYEAMLQTHIAGGWVDPQRYEGLIRFAIDAGKSTLECKLFYIVCGVASGLLSLDRLGAIDGKYLNRLPWLDYLVDKGSVKEPWQKPPGHAFTVAEMQEFARYLLTDPDPGRKGNQFTPGKRTKDFMWDKILRHPKTEVRNNKGVRKGDEIDHEDTYFILPLVGYKDAIKACGSSGGRRAYFTAEGYMNAYSGFNEYIKRNGGFKDLERTTRCIISYSAFDSVLDSRHEPTDAVYSRLDDSNYRRKSVVDGHAVKDHKDQLKGLILAIGNAYGKDFSKMFEKEHDFKSKAGAEHQNEIQSAINRFPKEFEDLVFADGGEKMFAVINSTPLYGTGETVRTSAQRKATEAEDAAAREAAGEEVEEKPAAGGGKRGGHF